MNWIKEQEGHVTSEEWWKIFAVVSLMCGVEVLVNNRRFTQIALSSLSRPARLSTSMDNMLNYFAS